MTMLMNISIDLVEKKLYPINLEYDMNDAPVQKASRGSEFLTILFRPVENSIIIPVKKISKIWFILNFIFFLIIIIIILVVIKPIKIYLSGVILALKNGTTVDIITIVKHKKK